MAILMVMLIHFFVYSGGAEALLLRATPRLAEVLDKIFLFGGHGVDLFFVLSGFLITGILWDSKGGKGYFKSFYARRVLRIFPLYYGVLTLVFVVAPLARWTLAGVVPHFPVNQLYYWAYLGNLRFSVPTPGFQLFHFWSLAVEEQFYFVWPLLVWACSRRRLLQICAALIILAPATRVFLFLSNLGDYHLATLPRADQLAMGAFLALVMRGPMGPFGLRRKALPWVYVAFPLLMVAVFVPRKWATDYVQIIEYSIATVAFGLLLVLALTARPGSALSTFFTSRPLKWMGKYSYGMYVFHFLFIPEYHRLLPLWVIERLIPFAWIAVLLHVGVNIGLTMVVAWVSWHLYEKQFLRLKRRFRRASSSDTSCGEGGKVGGFIVESIGLELTPSAAAKSSKVTRTSDA